MKRAWPFVHPRRLREAGILGMNRRNHAYVSAWNPRVFYPRVDDKLQTKILAVRAGLAVPRLIGVIRYQHAVKGYLQVIGDATEFVVKPSRGSAGKGILVIVEREGNTFIKASGGRYHDEDMQRHLSNLLSGLYSLGGQNDVALIEERVQPANVFEPYSYRGIPDVRIIVYRGYPVMAMIRLSTARSDGKANLHQGAVGVGISIRTGRALSAVQLNQRVSRHPDTHNSFDELQVPQWQAYLELATSCAEFIGLGYYGADIVLDRERGPLILELNARPGLAIQTANRCGLRGRLEAIDALCNEPLPPVAERVARSQALFR